MRTNINMPEGAGDEWGVKIREDEEEVVLGAGSRQPEVRGEKLEIMPFEMKAFEPRINGDTEVRFEPVVPWPEPVIPGELLDELKRVMRRFVVLPPWGPETMALWTLHTYAFHLQEVSTYLGVESPAPR